MSLRYDLNGDNQITSANAAIALTIAAGGGSTSCDACAHADVNGDHWVTSLDALMILQVADEGFRSLRLRQRLQIPPDSDYLL